MVEKKNIILELGLEFALSIIQYCDLLENQKRYVIANQLLKSGTSIGANIHEAQSAESVLDFVHKLKIADKEAIETEYWLKLCRMSKHFPDTSNIEEKLEEIRRLLNAIISKTKKKIALQEREKMDK